MNPALIVFLLLCSVFVGVGVYLYRKRKDTAAAVPATSNELALARARAAAAEAKALAASESADARVRAAEAEAKAKAAESLLNMKMKMQTQEAPKPKKVEPKKPVVTYADIDTTKGHPRGYGSHHVPYGGTWHTVSPGKAQTPEACWEHAKRNRLSNWGWRSHDKSCWSYMDSYLWSGGGGQSSHNHIGGCTEAGMKLDDGCMDFKKGDVVIGHKGGLAGGYNNYAGQEKMTFKKCRLLAAKKGIRTFGYRTNRHPNSGWTNTCFAPNNADNMDGFIGNGSDHAHLMACTNPRKKMVDDCR